MYFIIHSFGGGGKVCLQSSLKLTNVNFCVCGHVAVCNNCVKLVITNHMLVSLIFTLEKTFQMAVPNPHKADGVPN